MPIVDPTSLHLPAITVQDLTKSYGEVAALRGLSFDVPRGETLGLLGPNGAGKSTAIQILTGLLRADSGRALVDQGMPHLPAIRRRIGVAPQALSLYEELTAAENLAFFGRLYGLGGSPLRERIDWCLEFSGLKDRARHRAATFSGGMKRRLNIAIALIHEPQVLFLDEPTVGVDPQSRNHIFESIHRLQETGLTILYTTHYMEEARRLCHRVAIMDKGQLMALDTATNLIAKHGGASKIIADVEYWPKELNSLRPSQTGQLLTTSTEPLLEVARWTNAGAKLSSLQVTSPDLECVFLNLTGRTLRD
jgi:ABC-2 type transport system ATP-binding protein